MRHRADNLIDSFDPEAHADGMTKQEMFDFIKEHLANAVRAANEGSNCHGYMLWAFTDNVSPRNAFKNRYGLVEVDREHGLERRLKKSAAWYKQTAESNSFCFDEVREP